MMEKTLPTSALFAIVVLFAAVFPLAGPSLAEEQGSAILKAPYGFEDVDKDGVNDLFRDAEGDGLDDVTGKAYLHTYPYCDKDGDGKNDFFQDADGNGRNDLFKHGKRIGKVFLRLSLDADDDGKNDVTGRHVPGYKLGKPFRRAADSLVERETKEAEASGRKPTRDESRQQCR